jgi:predicted alpha/beta-hydrolase family hydrolase
MSIEPLRIARADGAAVSGLWQAPDGARACRSMVAIAEGLSRLGVATLRYQFPYMELGKKRVDSPAVAQAVVRAAVAAAQERAGGLALFAGGKSFGGRMTSQAQAKAPLAAVRGLVFFGFPLHPAGKPSVERAAHLSEISIPMLFVQGTRDTLADPELLQDVIGGLGARARLQAVPDADHSFHVPARTGRKDAEVLDQALADAVAWMLAAAA